MIDIITMQGKIIGERVSTQLKPTFLEKCQNTLRVGFGQFTAKLQSYTESLFDIFWGKRKYDHPGTVLIPAISWVDYPLPESRILQKFTQNTQQKIQKCIKFTPPPDMWFPRTQSLEFTLILEKMKIRHSTLPGFFF